MKLLSRVNVAAACFVAALIGVVNLNLMVQGGAESKWQIVRAIVGVTLFGFFFIRTSLLYLREGEPADEANDADGPASGTQES